MRPLENPETARELIPRPHQNGAKVLLSVGGWSYNDMPLENVFMEAAAGAGKLAGNIMGMCGQYGFDGADMDWEHPQVDGTSAKQYDALMLALAERLHGEGKLLTAAVLSGAIADGNIYYDASAHTNTVLNAVDCGTYWKGTRGLPAHKVVLGVSFYTRPGWVDYGAVLTSVPL